MARSVGRYVSLEMVLLCLGELLLSFVVVYAMLTTATAPELPAPASTSFFAVRPDTANLAAMLAFTMVGTSGTIGLYRPELFLRRRRFLLYAGVAVVLAYPAVILVSQVLRIRISGYYLLWTLKVLLAWAGCLLLSRWIFAVAVRHRIFVRNVAVVGHGERAARLAEILLGQRGRLFELAGVFEPRQIEQLPDTGEKVWALVVAADPGETLPTERLLALKLAGVEVFDDVTFWERHLGRMDLANTHPNWLVFAGGVASGPAVAAVRRTADLLMATALLLLTLPLMLVVAALVKLDSKGPVFYRQERVGLHGQVFTLFKFRSMRLDAEAAGQPRWAARNDPRVTRVGKFTRATRIDELPQLFNVLLGQMSFIGPRPERPAFVEELARSIPMYRDRSFVKPGITGWAQVNFPYGASVEDARQKLSYDLYYVKNRSLFLDALILLSTVRVILFQEGAR